jgi:hypothetical protein
MMAFNKSNLYKKLNEIPVKTMPLLPYYIDALRFKGFVKQEHLVDEILDNRMNSYVCDTPGVILPIKGVDPYLRDEELNLHYRMNYKRDGELYDEVTHFVEVMDDLSVFNQTDINEINSVLGRNPCMIQFLSPITYLVSRRL